MTTTQFSVNGVLSFLRGSLGVTEPAPKQSTGGARPASSYRGARRNAWRKSRMARDWKKPGMLESDKHGTAQHLSQRDA